MRWRFQSVFATWRGIGRWRRSSSLNLTWGTSNEPATLPPCEVGVAHRISFGFARPAGYSCRTERPAERGASELCQAAVDGDLAGGHEAAVRRREKGGYRTDLCRIGHALERSHRSEDLLAFFAQRFLREFRRRRTGRQHVDPDAGAFQVFRPGPGEIAHGGLARTIGAHARCARGAGARSGKDDRTAIAHQRQRLLNREDRALYIGVEGFVDVLGGDLAQRKQASRAGIGEDDVECSALGFHCRIEAVEVGRIGDRAFSRRGRWVRDPPRRRPALPAGGRR